MKRRKLKVKELLILSCIFFLSIFTTNHFVQATTFSWKWPSTNQTIMISNVTGESFWNNIISVSANKWSNITGSTIDVYYTSLSTNDDVILSYMGKYHVSLYAVVLPYDSAGALILPDSAKTPTLVKIRMYHDNVAKLLTDGKTRMFTHELGHALGLAHSPAGTVSVMEPNRALNYSGPTSYDYSEMARRY